MAYGRKRRTCALSSHPNVGPARIRPAAMRPALLQTEFGLSLKNGAGFGVSAGPSVIRIRFSGATRLRFAEGPRRRAPKGEGPTFVNESSRTIAPSSGPILGFYDFRRRKFMNFRMRSPSAQADCNIARPVPDGTGQSGAGRLRESEGVTSISPKEESTMLAGRSEHSEAGPPKGSRPMRNRLGTRKRGRGWRARMA